MNYFRNSTFGETSKVLAIFVLLFSLQLSFGQKNEFTTNPDEALTHFIATQPFEKTYLHTDKDSYFTDETIWLKLYLLNGSTHLNAVKSQLVYIELRDERDSLRIQKRLYVENLGAQGHIDLEDSFKPGAYTLKAYTSYMRNQESPILFEKQLMLLRPESQTPRRYGNQLQVRTNYGEPASVEPPILIQFFPEGGHLVDGIETSVGFVVTDSKGQGVSAHGKIVDTKNQLVSFFRSQEFGLGKFNIVPEANETYFAVVDDSLKFALPEALTKGFVLNTTTKEGLVLIDLKTNIPKGLNGTYLLGHLRGQALYKQRILQENGSTSFRVRFLTDGLPDGIAQFTLFSAEGEPLCERSLFISRSDNTIHLSIDTDAKRYEANQQVSAKLALVDHRGDPIEGSISFAVSSANHLDLSTKNSSMENWLLLNSEIGAAIANPNYFFEEGSFGRAYLLDVLLMTRDGEHSIWHQMARNTNKSEAHFPPERGIIVKGRIVDFKTKQQTKQAEVTLNLLGLANGVHTETQTTDSLGNFSFGPYVFLDTLKVVIKAESLEKRRNGKSQNLAVLIATSTTFDKGIAEHSGKATFVLQEETISNAQLAFSKTTTSSFQAESTIIELDEAVVTEKKKTRQDSINIAFKELSPLYTNPTYRFFVDSIPGAIGLRVFDILRRVPGARITGTGTKENVRLRQSYGGNPVFVVDGALSTIDVVKNMYSNEIEFIDVLHHSAAGAYINMAGYGVVVIYTKGALNMPTKKNSYALPNIIGYEVKGFAAVRDFPTLDYSDPAVQKRTPDTRSTLHWQPEIQLASTEKENASNISFYTGDVPGLYVIKVEGITGDGRPISAKKIIEVAGK